MLSLLLDTIAEPVLLLISKDLQYLSLYIEYVVVNLVDVTTGLGMLYLFYKMGMSQIQQANKAANDDTAQARAILEAQSTLFSLNEEPTSFTQITQGQRTTMKS